MRRTPEPELMLDEAQARAYAAADFEAPNALFLALLQERLPGLPDRGRAVDLGCGPGDITLRFARAFPGWSVEGIDGSPAMLTLARRGLAASADLAERVRFERRELPAPCAAPFDLIFSNSLLHHLHDPQVLWSRLVEWARPDAALFLMDLARPESPRAAQELVDLHARGEPDVLRRDFYNSLLAAWRPEEIVRQLRLAGLDALGVERVSDRHLVVQGPLVSSGGQP